MFLSIVIFGAVLNAFGTLVYFRNTLKGQTKPNRVTWLLWAAAPLIGSAVSLANEGGWAILPVFAIGLCSLAVFIASFFSPTGYWELKPLDYVCGACSVAALVLWLVVKQPDLAVGFAILSDLLAALPTAIKAWTHPQTESSVNFATSAVSAATSFLVLPNWRFSTYAFSLYLIVVDVVVFLIIERKRFRRA